MNKALRESLSGFLPAGGFRFVAVCRVSDSTQLLLTKGGRPVEHPIESVLASVFKLANLALE